MIARVNMQALHRDNLAVARELLSSGISLMPRTRKDLLRYILQRKRGPSRLRQLSSRAGATIDLENRFGNTPLFMAVFNSKGKGALRN